jgi:ribonuclease HI
MISAMNFLQRLRPLKPAQHKPALPGDTQEELILFVDAAVQPGRTGLGMVLRARDGQVIGWAASTARGMTNNEAEYAALIHGLEHAEHMGRARLAVFSDSRVVVEQMRGVIGVHNAGLKRWHALATKRARVFTAITYTHVPRELNALADAIAADVLERDQIRRVLKVFRESEARHVRRDQL